MKTLTIIGSVSILLGLIFLISSLGIVSMAIIWPAILLLLGIGFFVAFFAAPKVVGLLMPASILVISSIPFFMCTLSGHWAQMATLWPIIVVSVAVGLLLMYFLGKREKGLLIAALILLAVSIIAYLLFNFIHLIFPVVFIAGGLILVFIGLGKRKKVKTVDQSEKDEDSSSTNDN